MSAPEGLLAKFNKLSQFAISCFLTSILKLLLNLAKNVIITRLLGPEARGAFALLNTTPSLIVSFGNLGFGLGSVFLLTKNKAPLKVVTGNAMLYLFAHGSLLTIIGSYIVYQLGYLISQDASTFAIIQPFLIAGIPLLLAQHIASDILLGIKKIHFLNFNGVISTLSPLLLLFLFWFWTANLLLSASLAWIGTIAIVIIIAFAMIMKLTNFRLKTSSTLMKEAFLFGLRGNASQFGNAITRRADVLFISHYHGMAEVGFYTVAVSISELLLTLPTSIAEPFMPIVMEMERDEGRKFSSLIIKYVLALMAAVCIIFFLFSKIILVLLFGKEFLPSLTPLLWLLPGMLSLSIYQFLKSDMYRLNRPGLLSWTSVIAMIINIILNFILIPRYSIAGAAIASSLSYGLSTFILLIFYRKLTNISLNELLFIRKIDVLLLKDILLKFLKKKKDSV